MTDFDQNHLLRRGELQRPTIGAYVKADSCEVRRRYCRGCATLAVSASSCRYMPDCGGRPCPARPSSGSRLLARNTAQVWRKSV